MGPLRKAGSLLWSSLPNTTAVAAAPYGSHGSRESSGSSGSIGSSNYTQTVGDARFTLLINFTGDSSTMIGLHNGRELFSVTPARVRVVTSLEGEVVGLIGIDTVPQLIQLTVPPSRRAGYAGAAAKGGLLLQQTVKPNEEWAVDTTATADGGGGAHAAMRATLVRSAPFVMPFS